MHNLLRKRLRLSKFSALEWTISKANECFFLLPHLFCKDKIDDE